VALLSGEAGIGKTRLVAELVATLDPAVAVLAGQGSQGAPSRPFQLLLEAVEPRVAAWDAVPEPLTDRSEPLRLLLAPVAPKLAGHDERDYGQEELLRAAVALVRELAGPDGALLVFEDLHWADAESLALFGRLAVTPDLPLLLVGTFRPEGVGRHHPLVELLAELERQRVVTTIALERLGRAGVAELLAAVYRDPVPFQVAEALHRRTGGNPFFLEELVVTAGRADPARLATLPLPWNLSEAVLGHLDDLSPSQRRVVDAAAILGRRISFDLLAAVTGSGEDELIAILRHLVAGNLMVEEEPDVFAFRHALTREAIAGRLLGRERRRLHEKALAAIQEAGGGDWAAVAWHAQGAGRYDELVEAARAGAKRYLHQGSTAEALRLAETGLTEADRDLDLLAAASKAAWMIGLLPLATEHGERWHEEAAATGDPVLEATALIHLARFYWEAREYQLQWRTVWAALRVAEPLGRSETLARAQALVAEAYMLNERTEEAVEWADKALAMADAVGCAVVRASALVNKGSALADTPDRHDEGIALLEQAIAEAEAGDFGYVLHRALFNLLVHQIDIWPPARSHAVLRRMRETGERTGRGSEAPGWAMHRSEIAVIEGDLEAALAAVRGARGHELVPLEGGSTRSGSTSARPPCCWSAASSTRPRRCWSATPNRWSQRRSPVTSAGCGPSAWRWRPGGATWPRSGSPWTASWRPRPGGAGAGSTATWASTAPSPPCGPGCPRPRCASWSRPSTGTPPSVPTAGARAGRLARTWRRPCWRPRATRPPPWPPTGRCSTTPTSTGPPTCGPTATTAPPAACWPSVTSPAPSTRPAPPPACWSAGPAGGATRPRPCCAASARARPRPTARTC
jgi:tetratricopeptide (TPR) repeat protein